MKRSLALSAVLVICTAVVTQAETVMIDYVTIGDPDNAADAQTGRGSVDHVYKISKYEVTAGQYCAFLNAKASLGDPYGLYSTSMNGWGSSYVARTGSGTVEDPYVYTVGPETENRPIQQVSFFDACRFANWLHNGQGDGDTETGAYTLANGNAAHNPEATVWIPTRDEWYKAAYYDGDAGVYYDYPTGTDEQPASNAIEDPDPGNRANFFQGSYFSPYLPTEVGEYENSGSPYGTFDQGGNLDEWTETSYGPNGNDYHYVLGGPLNNAASSMLCTSLRGMGPNSQSFNMGFRVAAVPEPGATVLCLLGVLCLAWRRP